MWEPCHLVYWLEFWRCIHMLNKLSCRKLPNTYRDSQLKEQKQFHVHLFICETIWYRKIICVCVWKYLIIKRRLAVNFKHQISAVSIYRDRHCSLKSQQHKSATQNCSFPGYIPNEANWNQIDLFMWVSRDFLRVISFPQEQFLR